MNDGVREYVYQPKWTAIVLGALFFGLCAAVLGAAATNNDRGLIINGSLELGQSAATTFYWILSALSAGFVILSAFLAYHRLTFQQRLVFSATALSAPASRWSRKKQTIAYRDITALSQAKVSGQTFLYLTHTGGKYTLAAAMLPSKTAFTEVCELLTTRIAAVRADAQL
ncbi:MAG: hypothetical protein LBF16_06595 [Pseudomonadales bacterium]|jgi:hypothetical protein|nr:hypothetical protein [Pseudomonadales bacterium]